MRKQQRLQRKERIEHILVEFKGLDQIKKIKCGKSKSVITSMRQDGGHVTYDRQHIADVFADVYPTLYACIPTAGGQGREDRITTAKQRESSGHKRDCSRDARAWWAEVE
eukprot:3309126-Pyramimonas_sp.AAC.1